MKEEVSKEAASKEAGSKEAALKEEVSKDDMVEGSETGDGWLALKEGGFLPLELDSQRILI